MAPGLKQSDGHLYMEEMLPVLKALWQGDTTHDGKYWKFPESTAVPKPLQKPHPPLWVAARSPHTYDIAVKNGCSILSWALSRPFSEVESYKQRLETALAATPGASRPVFATMRYTAVYDRPEQWEVPGCARCGTAWAGFENLFEEFGRRKERLPRGGRPREPSTATGEFSVDSLRQNLMFGTPDEVIRKLKPYEALGVDHYTYCATFGLGFKEQKRSLELFISRVEVRCRPSPSPRAPPPRPPAAEFGARGFRARSRIELIVEISCSGKVLDPGAFFCAEIRFVHFGGKCS